MCIKYSRKNIIKAKTKWLLFHMRTVYKPSKIKQITHSRPHFNFKYLTKYWSHPLMFMNQLQCLYIWCICINDYSHNFYLQIDCVSNLDWLIFSKNGLMSLIKLKSIRREGFRFRNVLYKPPMRFFQDLLTLWWRAMQPVKLIGNPSSLSEYLPVKSERWLQSPTSHAPGHTLIPNFAHSFRIILLGIFFN